MKDNIIVMAAFLCITGDDESPTNEPEHYQESADAENTGDDSVTECKSPVQAERRPLADLEDDMKKMFLNDYYSDCTDFGSPDALPPPPFDAAKERNSPPPSFLSVEENESPAHSAVHYGKENNLQACGDNEMESSVSMPEPMKLQNIEDILQQIQRHSSTLSPMSSRSEDGMLSEADTDRTLYRSRPPNAQLDLKKFAVLMKNDEDEDSAVAMSHDDMDEGGAHGGEQSGVAVGWSDKLQSYPRFGHFSGTKPLSPHKHKSPSCVVEGGNSDALAGSHFIYDPVTGNYFMWQDDIPSKVRNSMSNSSDFARNMNFPQNQKPSSLKDKDSVNTPSPSDNEHVSHIG